MLLHLLSWISSESIVLARSTPEILTALTIIIISSMSPFQVYCKMTSVVSCGFFFSFSFNPLQIFLSLFHPFHLEECRYGAEFMLSVTFFLL